MRAKPFLQSLWSYPKQAGELFQAQMVLVEKDTQEPEHVIVVLLGLRFGFIRRHQKYLPETLSIQNAAWTRVFPTVGKVIDSAVHARDVRCIINMVHRTYLIFVKNALL